MTECTLPEVIENFAQIYHCAMHYGVCRINKVEYLYDKKEDKLTRLDVVKKKGSDENK